MFMWLTLFLIVSKFLCYAFLSLGLQARRLTGLKSHRLTIRQLERSSDCLLTFSSLSIFAQCLFQCELLCGTIVQKIVNRKSEI